MADTTEGQITRTVRWGLCPECWAEGTINAGHWLNVGRNHYAYCDRHKVYWAFGSNIFGSWLHETKAKWDENQHILSQCKEVEPMHIQPPTFNITLELEGTKPKSVTVHHQ